MALASAQELRRCTACTLCLHCPAAADASRCTPTPVVIACAAVASAKPAGADACERARDVQDECHATGFMGPTGRGTDEHWGILGQVDIVNSTLGKAMGGATGVRPASRPMRARAQSPARGTAAPNVSASHPSRRCRSTSPSARPATAAMRELLMRVKELL
jgi:hypothetical protein